MTALIVAACVLVAVGGHPKPANYGVWQRVAFCESRDTWDDTAGGYEGGLQFLNSTWLANGGGRYAAHAYDATERQQMEIANHLLRITGWISWPSCSRQLGLR